MYQYISFLCKGGNTDVNEDHSQSNLGQIGNENLICGCDTGHQKRQINKLSKPQPLCYAN